MKGEKSNDRQTRGGKPHRDAIALFWSFTSVFKKKFIFRQKNQKEC